MLWDRGFGSRKAKRTPEQALAKYDFKFTLEGKRLHGSFVLVRMANDRERGKRTNWFCQTDENRSVQGRTAFRYAASSWRHSASK